MREQRLDAYLEKRDLESVWFARPNGFAWLTGGDSVVDRDAPTGVAAAGYDGEDVVVVTDTIEAGRLREEELDDDVEVIEEPWFETDLAEAVAEHAPEPAAADVDVPGFESVDTAELRQPLTDRDVELYRDLGRDAAAAVEEVARATRSSDTEAEVATRLRTALGERGIESPVALVGGAERAQQYRHFTPKDAELGEYALMSVTAQRHGLYASVSRTVAFDPPAWLDERHDAAARVETSTLAATQAVGREGGTSGDVFAALRDAYAAVGWEGEWRNHHQGGAAGFAGREWIATPDADDPVHLPMAYAWNPTVQGAKSEDTFLVTEEGVELLTGTGEWPTREAEAVDGDLALDRHAPLQID